MRRATERPVLHVPAPACASTEASPDASAGALAGVCAHVPAYPLDLLRTRIAGAVGAETQRIAVHVTVRT